MIHWFEIPVDEIKLYHHILNKYNLSEQKILINHNHKNKKMMILFKTRLDMEHSEMIWFMFKDEEKTVIKST